MRPVAISIQAPSGNINIVLEICNFTSSGYLSIGEIEKHIHTPSGHINTVPINLTHMLSDNLDTSAISKYTNTVSDDNQKKQYGTFLGPVAIQIQLKSIYTHFMPSGKIITV